LRQQSGGGKATTGSNWKPTASSLGTLWIVVLGLDLGGHHMDLVLVAPHKDEPGGGEPESDGASDDAIGGTMLRSQIWLRWRRCWSSSTQVVGEVEGSKVGMGQERSGDDRAAAGMWHRRSGDEAEGK
jgi:hypothetical protein